MNMDWISHLLFGLTLGAILLKDMSRQKMALVATASLLPDLDILWHHRSEFSITLNEESYTIMAGFIAAIAIFAAARLYFKEYRRR